RGSFGLAFQTGVYIQVAPKVFVNIDVEKVNIQTNLRASDGTDLGKIKVDPTLVGVGVGYRF
ncbi:MAG: hypothetical protein KA781_03910, partial [Aquabacterium sp.]|nr:hypothetical protein [Aquabacterium sp.]